MCSVAAAKSLIRCMTMEDEEFAICMKHVEVMRLQPLSIPEADSWA